MYTIDSCPCCLSKNNTSRWAVVAPFLAHYAVGQRPERCKLLECSDCSFRFFDVRLSPQEVDRLYAGYRGGHYFTERHRYEFWYSRKVNDGIGGDPAEIEERIHAMERFVFPHIDVAKIEKVLDYGGDRGQFIPESLGRSKYVFELSDAVPCPGVIRVGSESALTSMKFDFIMLLGVLEHCSDPAGILIEKIRPLMCRGGFLCVGVPYERYNLRFAGRGPLYRRYLNALLRLPLALVAVDFYSTICRVRCGGVPPLGFVKCHEHLNFFNERSIEALLKRTGFEVVDSVVETVVKYPARVESMSILARLK
jgi:Methyltransferase domain